MLRRDASRLLEALTLVAVTSCANVVRPPPPTPVASSQTAVPETTPAPREPPLIIAGKDGIFELDDEGAVVRRLGTSAEARAPRFIPGKQAIVFLKANAMLVELDLTTGTERVVAGPWLAKLLCPALGAEELTLQAEGDLELDADGRHVCLALYDRNVNMASFALSVRADLATREAELTFPFGCDQSERTKLLSCQAARPSRSEVGSFAFVYDAQSHTLRDSSQRVRVSLAGWDLAETSPGGRFNVLRGNFEEGDYVHFNLLVVDRRSGAVYPVPAGDSGATPSWPLPLTESELAQPSRARLGSRAGDYVGESTLLFASETRLVAGELLFLLEQERVVALHGDLAR